MKLLARGLELMSINWLLQLTVLRQQALENLLITALRWTDESIVNSPQFRSLFRKHFC